MIDATNEAAVMESVRGMLDLALRKVERAKREAKGPASQRAYLQGKADAWRVAIALLAPDAYTVRER